MSGYTPQEDCHEHERRRALTANELARAGHVSPSTASGHLAQLVQAGLLLVQQMGRHRYHRLASGEVARVPEGIMQLAAGGGAPRGTVLPGPRDADMRRARTCYDHIAGRLGVAISDRLLEQGAIGFDGDGGVVTDTAAAALAPLGIRLDGPVQAGRPVQCRPCLDWSERRPHVAGHLGTLICAHCLSAGWLRRPANTRALQITPSGAEHLGRWLGAGRWRLV